MTTAARIGIHGTLAPSMRRLVVITAALVIAGCGHRCGGTPRASSAGALARLKCAAQGDPASDAIKGGALVLLGEVHGTAEIPGFVGQLACAVARRRVTVWLALEHPAAEQGQVDAFLAGGDAAALGQGGVWRQQQQDGRGSAAMLGLLREVRRIRDAGGDVRAVLIDQPGTDRDKAMADAIAGLPRKPGDVVLALTGNVHARRLQGADWDPAYRPMGFWLVERGLAPITLDAATAGGSAWVCTGQPVTCGAARVVGTHTGARPFIRMHTAGEVGPYDGVFYVGTVSASPPALGD